MNNQLRLARSIAPATTSVPPSINLPDGSRAELRDGALELVDAEGRLLIRYRDGDAEIAAPRGDLRLTAPAGRVVIESAHDVAIEAGRDVVQRGGRSVEIGAASSRLRIDPISIGLRGDHLDVEVRVSRAAIGEATVVARVIQSSAERMTVAAEHYERLAGRVVERAIDSFREVAGLAEERAGRLRTLIRGAFSLTSESTDLTSTEETSIDGKRIHLG